MPYTVTSNADGCSGFAVVKEGENSPIPGGCHKTKADALAHMIAVQAAYEDGESRQLSETEDEGDDSDENLLPRQTAMYELYESIAENFGQWNQGTGADGAHYAEVSPFQDEGLICANCVFYEGGQRCEIVEGQIKPLAICKLWIIEESLLNTPGIKFVDGEPEEEPAEYNTRASVNLVAPAFMKASARRGLALHEEGYSGDGLRPQTVEDARKMANGEALSSEKWRKISPWIARHTVDLDAVQGDEITAGLVAMLLWGGGSSKASASRAKSYAERIVAQLEESREQPRDKLGRFGSTKSDYPDNPDDLAGMLNTEGDDFMIEQEKATDTEFSVIEAQQDWAQKLDGDSYEVLTQYAGEEHKRINKHSRGAPPPPLGMNASIDAEYQAEIMEDAIASAPRLAKPITVYRGLTMEAAVKIDRAQIGSTILDKGFASTSTAETTARDFAQGGAPILRIKLPKGTNAISMHPFTEFDNEHEILLQRGSQFKITGKSDNYIDLEVMP